MNGMLTEEGINQYGNKEIRIIQQLVERMR